MRKRKSKKSLKRRILRVIGVVIALPYILTLLYVFVPPVSTFMVADALSFKSVKRDWVAMRQISPQLIAAVVAAEDSAFCSHHGFDFNQLGKSLQEAYTYKEAPRGASTITMQTAKNLYLWNGRSLLRKVLEAPLTIWIELAWTKRRILEVYLNIAEWGDGIYGVDAAARHHFGVRASQLNAHQAALLAAALPDPQRRKAGHPGPGQLQMAAQIERRAAHMQPDLSCLQR